MNIAPLIPLAASAAAFLGGKIADVVNGGDNFLSNFADATSVSATQKTSRTDLEAITRRLVQELNNELHARRIASDSAATLKTDSQGGLEISGGSGADAFRFTAQPDSTLARLFSAWRSLSNVSPSSNVALQVSGADVSVV